LPEAQRTTLTQSNIYHIMVLLNITRLFGPGSIIIFEVSLLTVSTAELFMGWVDPRVGSGQDFSVFGGLSWVHHSQIAINMK